MWEILPFGMDPEHILREMTNRKMQKLYDLISTWNLKKPNLCKQSKTVLLGGLEGHEIGEMFKGTKLQLVNKPWGSNAQ